MKICTICNQTYPNDELNYCLADGGLLTKSNDDPPPTMMMNQARKTNEINWGNPPETNWSNQSNQPNWANQSPPSPMSPWQNQQMSQQNQGYMSPQMYQGQNQTLPIVSMVLGILSIVTCCYGFPFGIAAAITGYIGMNNANNNPMIYGGRGFAIAGLVMGIINLVFTLIIILLALAGSIK
jgi:Domain of unknown function (DUF4190)